MLAEPIQLVQAGWLDVSLTTYTEEVKYSVQNVFSPSVLWLHIENEQMYHSTAEL